MPKLNATQEIALDILDFIYFYDVVSLTRFKPTGENEAVLKYLNELIAQVIADRELSGTIAERYKHLLLCYIEMESTFNLDREVMHTGPRPLSRGDKWQLVRQMHEEAQELFINDLIAAGFSRYKFIEDIEHIMAESEIINMPNHICYGLVAAALSFDFDGCIAAHVYRKFLDIKIFETKKESSRNEYDYSKNEHACLRALLFIEFEIMRNKLFHKNDCPEYQIKYKREKISDTRMEREKDFLLKTYNFYRRAINTDFSRIYNYNLSNKDEVDTYLSGIEAHLCHRRYFSKGHSKWASFFGLWHLKYQEVVNKELPIYDTVNDENCSVLASSELEKAFGLTIQARNLYDYHVKYNDYFCFVTQTAELIMSQEKTGFVSPCLIYPFNYHPDLSEKMLNLFDGFDIG